MNASRAFNCASKALPVRMWAQSDLQALTRYAPRCLTHSSTYNQGTADYGVRRVGKVGERSRSVASYYYNSSLDAAAAKVSCEGLAHGE